MKSSTPARYIAYAASMIPEPQSPRGRPSPIALQPIAPVSGSNETCSIAPSIARIPDEQPPPSKAGPEAHEVQARHSAHPSTISPFVPRSTRSETSSEAQSPAVSRSPTTSPPTNRLIAGRQVTGVPAGTGSPSSPASNRTNPRSTGASTSSSGDGSRPAASQVMTVLPASTTSATAAGETPATAVAARTTRSIDSAAARRRVSRPASFRPNAHRVRSSSPHVICRLRAAPVAATRPVARSDERPDDGRGPEVDGEAVERPRRSA